MHAQFAAVLAEIENDAQALYAKIGKWGGHFYAKRVDPTEGTANTERAVYLDALAENLLQVIHKTQDHPDFQSSQRIRNLAQILASKGPEVEALLDEAEKVIFGQTD